MREFLMTGWDPISQTPHLKTLIASHAPLELSKVETTDYIATRLQKMKNVDILDEEANWAKLKRKKEILDIINKRRG